MIGRIARAHGNRGQVIVNATTDFPGERFRAGAEVFVERGGRVEPLRIDTVRFHRDRPIVGFAGVTTMDDAEALAGLELSVPADTLMPLPAGTYYHHDLVGCTVETRSGQRIGSVEAVDASGGGARLVVAGKHGEILVPLAAEICVAIDVGARRIVVEAPEGLLELNE